jgi:hypothetical protein
MQILFQPRAAMDYNATAELSARFATEEEPLRILTLELCGTGRHPRLVFDCSHVILPAVPLGVYSSRTFRVVNDGYDNLDIQFRLPADTENIPLELKFPEGTMVGIAKASVPAVVLFKASRPTSFTANIEFMDEDGAMPLINLRLPAPQSLLLIVTSDVAHEGSCMVCSSQSLEPHCTCCPHGAPQFHFANQLL